jgi:hypothetical protein
MCIDRSKRPADGGMIHIPEEMDEVQDTLIGQAHKFEIVGIFEDINDI